jgi:nucleoside-diphosphate-sugar epimerase
MDKMTDIERQDIEFVANLPYRWDVFKDKVIMISGGTGFIGNFISEVFRYRNEKFSNKVKIVSLSRRVRESDDTVVYLKSDINYPICYDGRIDYILHLASNTHPQQYAEDPVGTITTNVLGCNNLLKLAHDLNVKRFLLASSVEIYGLGSEYPMDENFGGYIDCNNARSGYNEAKRTCEALCKSYMQQYGVDTVTVRLARVFGADRKQDTKAMSQFINKAVAGEDIVLKSKGVQRYSYCYIADVVSAIIKVLLDGASGEVYNVSGEDEGLTLGDYAEYIAKLVGKKVVYDIEYNQSVSKATKALLDISKIKKIGWSPKYSVKQGLLNTLSILGCK